MEQPSKNLDMTRVRRSISFDSELLEEIDKIVKEDYHFKDRSHFIEIAAREYLKGISKLKVS